MSKRALVALAFAVLVVIAGGLTVALWDVQGAPPSPGIANPASEHCVNIGGELEISRDSNGNEIGICHLRDGQACEEWALFRDQQCVQPN